MITKRNGIFYHTSAGGFVLYNKKVLLVKNFYHGGIIPPHGHKERGETLLEAAKREICEETGYCHLRPVKKLSPVKYTYRVGKETHIKTEHRWVFALQNIIQKKKLQNKESKGLQNRWYTIEGALRAATFENTKIHVRQIRQLLKQRKYS